MTGEIPVPSSEGSVDAGLESDNRIAIFMETIRDVQFNYGGNLEYPTVVHEIGHSAGGSVAHTPTGLLQESGLNYMNETRFADNVRRLFREVGVW